MVAFHISLKIVVGIFNLRNILLGNTPLQVVKIRTLELKGTKKNLIPCSPFTKADTWSSGGQADIARPPTELGVFFFPLYLTASSTRTTKD